MSDIARRSRGDWAAIKAASKRADDTAEVLGLEREELISQIEPLRLSVEEGAIEYKRGQIDHAFHVLDSARFKNLEAKTLKAVEQRFARVIYVAIVQHLFAERTLNPRVQKPDANQPEIDLTPDVNSIIKEMQQRVQEHPEARNDQPVKNILMLVSRYSRELEELKSFTQRASKNAAAAYAANFKKSSEEIFESIKRNYADIQARERSAASSGPTHIMLRFDIQPLSRLFLKQAEFACTMRATIAEVREAQYGIREALSTATEKHQAALDLLTEERNAYQELTGSPELAVELASAFAHEVARITERDTSWTP